MKISNIYIRVVLAKVVKQLTSVIPKKNNLILFSAWFGKRYCENSMYLFEYCLNNSNFDVHWFTKEQDLYTELKEKGIPVVYSKSFKGIWYQIRAKMLVSTVQFSDFSQFFFSRCIYLDLDHGHPGKPVTYKLMEKNNSGAKWYYQCRSRVDFYKTAASRFSKDILSKQLDVDSNHCIFSNMPRVDVLFDSKLQEGQNRHVAELKREGRIISYLPTHRSSGRKQMNMSTILDLPQIQKLCEKRKAFFILKKHFYHKNEEEDFSKYPNIIDITKEEIDTQVLLAQTDLLVTDFSSCYVDYLPTDRPIVFYAYDYDDYMANERDYYWKYDMIKAGYTTKSKDDFIMALEKVTDDWSDLDHKEGRKEMREIYYDPEIEMGTTRKKLVEIMDQLIKGTYVPYDWSKK